MAITPFNIIQGHRFLYQSKAYNRGVYTRGGMVRDAPWRKFGGKCCDDNDDFGRV